MGMRLFVRAKKDESMCQHKKSHTTRAYSNNGRVKKNGQKLKEEGSNGLT